MTLTACKTRTDCTSLQVECPFHRPCVQHHVVWRRGHTDVHLFHRAEPVSGDVVLEVPDELTECAWLVRDQKWMRAFVSGL